MTRATRHIGPKAALPFNGHFSPDGRWARAYVSRESGAFEVYVTSFDPAKILDSEGAVRAGKWQISNNRGTTPRWRREGKELFYMNRGKTIISVEVKGQGKSFELGRTQRLFVSPATPFLSTYDVTPDGQRFVIDTSHKRQIELDTGFLCCLLRVDVDISSRNEIRVGVRGNRRALPINDMLSICREKARATHDPDYLALVRAVQALSNELRDLERNLLMG